MAIFKSQNLKQKFVELNFALWHSNRIMLNTKQELDKPTQTEKGYNMNYGDNPILSNETLRIQFI